MTPKAIYRILFNRRKKETSRDGRFPIEIEAYIPIIGERRFIPTSLRVLPEQWNDRDKLVTYKHPNYVTLNKRIRDLVNQFESIEEEYRINRVPFHLKYLDTKPRKEKEQSFIKFWEVYVKTNPKKLKYETLKTKKTALKYLKRFQQDVLFSDIDLKFILDYEDYLLDYEYFRKEEYHSLKSGFIHSLLKDLKAVLNVAIQKDYFLLERSPFQKFSIQKYAKYGNSIRYLIPEEVRAISDLKFDNSNKHLIKIRDMFLLSVYTGLRYGDVVKLNRKSLVEKSEGFAIDMVQEKTDEKVYIPVFSMFNKEPEIIIKTYLALGRKYLFDDISNQYVNRELKILASMAGVNKNLTFHMGRHTCATWLLSNGLQLEFVKEILGHKNIKTTQIYAKVLNQALEQAIGRLSY